MDGPRTDQSQDTINAGPGNDVVIADNDPARRDIIDCGAGFDRAVVDFRDLVANCERVFFR